MSRRGGSPGRMGGGRGFSPVRTAAIAGGVSGRPVSPVRAISPVRNVSPVRTGGAVNRGGGFVTPPRSVSPSRQPPGAPRRDPNARRHWVGRYNTPRTYLPPLLGLGTGLLLGSALGGGLGYPYYPAYPSGIYPSLPVYGGQQTTVNVTQGGKDFPIPEEMIDRIAGDLDLESLANFCNTNSQTASICSNDLFWKGVFLKRYPNIVEGGLPTTTVRGLDSIEGRPLRSWREYLQLFSGMMYAVDLPVDIYLIREKNSNGGIDVEKDKVSLDKACLQEALLPTRGSSTSSGTRTTAQCVAILEIDDFANQDKNLAFTGTITFYYTSESTLTSGEARYGAFAGNRAWAIPTIGVNNNYYYIVVPKGSNLPNPERTPQYRRNID